LVRDAPHEGRANIFDEGVRRQCRCNDARNVAYCYTDVLPAALPLLQNLYLLYVAFLLA